MKIDFPLEVALVDDEPGIVELLCTSVESIKELSAVGFTDSVKAYEEIKKREIRVVLTDIDMPNLRGDDLILKCRKLPWSVDIIVMTAVRERDLACRCFDAGAREILIKPSGYSDIIHAFNRILDRYKIWFQTMEDSAIDYSSRAVQKMDGDEEI